MKPAKSGRELAKTLGVGESTVREYRARPDFPVRKEPPWSADDVAKIAAWRGSLQEDRSADPTKGIDPGQINLRAKAETMLFTRAKRRRFEGELIERRLIDKALEELAKLFVQSLDDLERALPPELAGKDPGVIEQLLRQRFHAVRDALAGNVLLQLEVIDQAVKAANQPKARGRPAAQR